MERNDELGNVGNTGSDQDRAAGGTTGGLGSTGGASGGMGGSAGSSGGLGSTGGYGDTGGTEGSLGYGAGAGLGDSSAGLGGSSGLGDSGTSGLGSGSRVDDLKDRARNLAGGAQERLADVGSKVRDGAGNVKNSLANALEAGATKLRSNDVNVAGVSPSGEVTVTDGRMHQVTDGLASGMQASAEWLRETDLDGMKRGVEEQVRTHPGRTLLIAVGLGYLLGKAFRR
jgi:hypothetical protein